MGKKTITEVRIGESAPAARLMSIAMHWRRNSRYSPIDPKSIKSMEDHIRNVRAYCQYIVPHEMACLN